MKQHFFEKIWHSGFRRLPIFLSTMAMVILFSMTIFAQTPGNLQISGSVTDEAGEPLIGVSVVLKGTSSGTITDIEGKYSISVPASSTIDFSIIGFKKQSLLVTRSGVFNIIMEDEFSALDEVVVVGYGTVSKRDLTGSVSTIRPSELNKGLNVMPSDMLVGKVPGLLVVPGDGGPGSGASIRIRGGSSLSATNSPLIVIDGLPIANDANVGQSNVLASLNPNDIESFTVLKDASSTAIYGSRASNGVIIITTKKGSGSKKLKVDYSSTYSANVNTEQVPTLSATDFRRFMDEFYPTTTARGRAAQAAMNYQYPDGTIGEFSTNWQDHIYQVGLSTDQNVSISGGGAKYPFRVSIGYTDQTGTLKGSSFKRFSEAVNFSPKFFNNHLAVNLNLRASQNPNKNVDSGIINAAATFDPTKPIWAYATSANDPNDLIQSPGQYSGGYFQWLNPDGSINRNASQNPVSQLLDNNYNRNTAYRYMGNLQLDYSLHFLPELHAVLNLGMDYSTHERESGQYIGSYSSYSASLEGPLHLGQGTHTISSGERKNQSIDFYLNYDKEIKAISSKLSATGGYSWQHFYRDDVSQRFTNRTDIYESEAMNDRSSNPGEYYLISLFGRVNYTLMERYLVTATWRSDGTSRFSKQNRWGAFPSVAFAWRISEESFMQDFRNLDNLKLRLGWGRTGQQDIGSDYYQHIATYELSKPDSGSQYYFDDEIYQLLSPTAYNENLKWETTRLNNIALDFSFYRGRVSGSVDYFDKRSTDLLNSIPIAAGSNFINQMTANIGSLNSHGVEMALNVTPVRTKDFSWDIGLNATWLTAKIDKLTAIFNPEYFGVPTGGISMGTGNNIQIHSEGFAPNTFYVFEQVYDENGYPIQNTFVDQDENGIIDDMDLVRKHSPRPSLYGGLNMQFRYKAFDFGFNSHCSFDNWVFNDYNSARSSADYAFSNGVSARNVTSFVYNVSRFSQPITVQQAKSDLFLENASFWKLDNVSFGYSFSKILGEKLNGRVSLTAQNVLTITKFSGADPEISSGIANNAWPRPRVFVLGLTLNY